MIKLHESNDRHDYPARFQAARRKLPLKLLMERHGRGPANGNWTSFPKCPYCEGAHCAGVFASRHGDLFKCHRTSCRSGTAEEQTAWDEIGFLAFELGQDRRAAIRIWLSEAGEWTETQPHATKKPEHNQRDSHHFLAPGDGQPSQHVKQDELATPASQSPLQVFIGRISLSDSDRQELKTKRGLSDKMIDAGGFLTNDWDNLVVLNELALEYSEQELLQCGLYRRNGRTSRPSGQFFGYGIVGKKKRLPEEWLESGDYDDLADDDFVWEHREKGHCNPMLIPYYDLDGELAGLRPHKGFPKGQKPCLYLAGGRGAGKPAGQAVIVEGEFQAAALLDAVGDSWAVAAVPGITQVKNLHVWADILAWLKKIGAHTVVVVFDNEEHGNPQLSGYRPQLEERFESEIWARVCAVRLKADGYNARVGHLPDEWRDNRGKADWDSALVKLQLAGCQMPEIRALYENVLGRSVPVEELSQARLYSGEEERVIGDRVAVLTYVPALPWGGRSEQKMVRELRKLAAGKLQEWAPRVQMLADAYEHTYGWYYELKISEQRQEKLYAELRQADGATEIMFLKLALKGTPSLVAPFRVIPNYVLLKPDGGRDRLVRLVNIRNELSDLVPLDENSFTAARDWRRWVATVGNYGWEKGDGALQALQRDINFVLARRTVIQLVWYGCERPGSLWLLDDCAFPGDGTLVVPDTQGVYWHAGRAYIYLRDAEKIPKGEEGQQFRLKSPPRMQPEMGLVFAPGDQMQLQKGVPDDPLALRELLGNLVVNLNDSYGGYDGLALIGATLAYFGGPEVYRLFGQFPGIWITGEKGSGKTYTAKWLMALHGFTELEAGLSFKTSTAVGVQIAMGQYANIPPWGDEYKEDELRDSNTKGVIHGGFNREVANKWSPDGRTRTIRTGFLVTGETTCNNTATMSRFVSAVAARARRKGTEADQMTRLKWLQDHRKFYFVIGRVILRERDKFAGRLLQGLSVWEELPELINTDPRGRFSYGVAYAAFQALNEIIPIYTPNDSAKFRVWLIEKAKACSGDLDDRGKLPRFWRDILTMLDQGFFGRSPEEISRHFKVLRNRSTQPVFSELQTADAVVDERRNLVFPWLALRPETIMAFRNKYYRNQGLGLPPTQSDIQGDLRVCPYFVPPDARQGHQIKLVKGERTGYYCWVIDLAKFQDMGIREVSDEVWKTSFYRDGDPASGLIPIDEWVDPRKGELFRIVDALKAED